MKTKNLIINLGLVLSLLFCMAFACNDGDKQGSKSDDETTTRTTNGNSQRLGTQAGIGERYGSRDPFTCVDSSQPSSKDAPSPEQAADYVTCSAEEDLAGHLYLVEDVTVNQISKGHAFIPYEYPNIANVDVDVPIYPIRGSYKSYQCDPVSEYMQNAGKSCRLTDNPNAVGICYKDTFGDWHCSMGGDKTSKTISDKAPPPQ